MRMQRTCACVCIGTYSILQTKLLVVLLATTMHTTK